MTISRDRTLRRVAYGPSPSQVGELYLPKGRGRFPVVVLIHGGYWTAMFDRRQVVALADDLVGHGYAVWNIEYRRIGESGGGWPGTFLDVAAAVDAVASIDSALDVDRVAVVGHSAGGHLATWTAHRSVLHEDSPGAAPEVRPLGVVSLSGVLDLVTADVDRFGSVLADPDAKPPAGSPPPSNPGAQVTVAAQAGDGIVRVLLGGHATDVPERYNQASPTELPAADVPMLVLHGAADDAVRVDYSRAYAEAAAAKGGNVRFALVPDTNHFGTINLRGRSWILASDFIHGLLS